MMKKTSPTTKKSPTTKSDPQRWRIDVEYDGTGFVGWQVQPQGDSIQGALEDALAAILGHAVRVSGSGRTDAGVHARQQVASFIAEVERSAKSIRDGTNANLPPQIAVTAATPVPMEFDARRHVIQKCYRYTWLCRPSRSPLMRNRAWHLRHDLDVPSMQIAAQLLVGTHDFSAFRAAGCQAAHATRTLQAASVEQVGQLVHFRVVGNGFLRHMVRIVSGSLWEVGRGAWSPERFSQVLTEGAREHAGKTAPAHGLTLESVQY